MALLNEIKPYKEKGKPLPGIFYREARPWEDGRPGKDHFLVLRYTLAGKTRLELWGWESEKGNGLTAANKLKTFRANAKAGIGPASLADEKALAESARQTAAVAAALAAEKNKTFGELVDEYLKGLNVRPSTLQGYTVALTFAKGYKPAKGLPAFEKTPINEISRRRLAEMIEAKGKTSPSAAVLLRSALSAFYSWLAEPAREYVDANPIPSIPKPKANAPRERKLNDKELAVLWKALDGADNKNFARLLKFLFLTGCRLSEALGMNAGEVDGDWWTVPGQRFKGKRPHRVFLCKTAKTLIDGKEYPFCAPARLRKGKTEKTIEPPGASSISRWLLRNDHFELKAFSAHDARRTVGSGLAKLHFPLETIAAVLGHKLQGVTAAHYVHHDQDDDKKKAFLAWERHVMAVTAGKLAKVVNIK